MLILENFRAAYKGFADCIRLLLFLDAYRARQDKEGKSCILMWNTAHQCPEL